VGREDQDSLVTVRIEQFGELVQLSRRRLRQLLLFPKGAECVAALSGSIRLTEEPLEPFRPAHGDPPLIDESPIGFAGDSVAFGVLRREIDVYAFGAVV